MDQRSIILKLLDFSNRHSKIVIGLSLLLTIFFGWFASGIKLDANIESLLPEDEDIINLMSEYAVRNGDDELLIIAVEDNNLFTLEKLAILSESLNDIEDLPEIHSGITPFNMVFFQKIGRRLEQIPFSREKRAPFNETELIQFKEVIQNNELINNLLISKDKTVLCSFFSVKKSDAYSDLMIAIEEIISGTESSFKTHFSGSVPFLYKTEKYLLRDLSTLMLLSILVILAVYYISFKSVKAVILPVLIVLMGTIWAIGFMAILDFSLSFVSVITPPLVLTLGSSYSIHILNQYYRESGKAKLGITWIPEAVEHITKTILLASATTVIGFLSLFITSMKLTKEFAIAASVGILACALLSLFFFPAVLSYLKAPKEKGRKKVLDGVVAQLMKKIGIIVLRFKYIILIILAATIGLFIYMLQFVNYNMDAVNYFPMNDSVIEDMLFLTDKFGGFEEIGITLTAPENEKKFFLKPENLRIISDFQDKLSECSDICFILSYADYLQYMNKVMNNDNAIPETSGFIMYVSRFFSLLTTGNSENPNEAAVGGLLNNFANEDFSRININLRIYDSETTSFINEKSTRRILNNIKRITEENLPPEIKAEIWGNAFRYLSLLDLFKIDLQKSLLLSIFLVFFISIAAFRSVGYGFFAIIPLLTGVMSNFILMAFFKIPLDMTTIMVSSIAVGVGVDNAIHFIIQFRKQIKEHDINKSIINTLVITGRPILLTTISITSGLIMLSFSSFKPIIYFGILVVFTLATTCIGTIFILPSFLTVWKGHLFKNRKKNPGI